MPKPLRLKFSSRAFLDIQNALQEVHKLSPQASRDLRTRIDKTCQNLVLFPRMGVRLPLPDVREEIRFFPLSNTPFSIIFSVTTQEVRVLRFLLDPKDWKTREDWA